MRRFPLALLLASAAAAGCGAAPGAPVEQVVIPPRASLRVTAESLSAHGVIGSRRWFRLMARVGGYDRRLQSGTFELPRGAGARAALRALAEGRSRLNRFTVPEGYTLLDIAAAAERELGIPAESVLAAARDTALLREFEVPAPTFEGFLRPETYLFAPGISAATLVRAMAETFREDWDPAWTAAAAAQGLDRLQVVTLASLVEGEAAVDSDRELVAAVYRNRLRLGMPMQADPTVQYAIQLATGARKPRLYEKDYGFESPYNTYLHAGLPPGPVGAPNRRSIEAVLHPAPVPYLYLVAGSDGRHIFSRTYAEHLRAVRRVQR
ncbi:MAG TPA: endolytic transglycosylase MltG [Gemmatimonadales bacterium]